MDKHLSILQKIVNYGRKTFYNIGPAIGQGYKPLLSIMKEFL